MLVALYLAAIVAANVLVAHYGPSVAVLNAALFIGLDLTVRDALHDRYSGSRRVLVLGLLVLAGSLLTYAVGVVFDLSTTRIAVASTLAFAGAFVADALVYQAFRSLSWLERSNRSNLAGAAVDSVVFPWIAFSGLDWHVVLTLFCAKVAGGVVWSLVLDGRRRQAAVAA